MAENGIPLVFDKCSAHHTSQPRSRCNVNLAISQSEICHSGFWVTRYQLLLKWNFWDIASQTIHGDPIWGSLNVPLAEMFVKCYSITGLIFRLGNGCDSPSVGTLTPWVIPLLKRNVQFTMVMVQWPWDQPYLRRLSLSSYLVPTTQTGTSFLAQQLVGLISITAVLFADTHTHTHDGGNHPYWNHESKDRTAHEIAYVKLNTQVSGHITVGTGNFHLSEWEQDLE